MRCILYVFHSPFHIHQLYVNFNCIITRQSHSTNGALEIGTHTHSARFDSKRHGRHNAANVIEWVMRQLEFHFRYLRLRISFNFTFVFFFLEITVPSSIKRSYIEIESNGQENWSPHAERGKMWKTTKKNRCVLVETFTSWNIRNERSCSHCEWEWVNFTLNNVIVSLHIISSNWIIFWKEN